MKEGMRMSVILVISQLMAKVGEKVQGLVQVPGTNVMMPVTLINGVQSGKTILITAGVHGCEYPGIKTVMELAKEIDSSEVKGQLILVHPVNTQAFVQRTATLVPEDGKNLLRVFPGNQEGTISEKIAYFMTQEMISLADFYFDIHGGDLHEDLIPHLYYPGAANKEVVQASIEVAKLFNVPYYVKSSLTTGTYTSSAVLNETPSLLIERGGCGLCEEEVVLAYKQDLFNVLTSMNVLSRQMDIDKCEPVEITEAVYLDSSHDGCWTCFVKAGQWIKAGDPLGEVTDYFGNIIETYYANFDAVVLYQTVAYSITKGSSLVAYGRQ